MVLTVKIEERLVRNSKISINTRLCGVCKTWQTPNSYKSTGLPITWWWNKNLCHSKLGCSAFGKSYFFTKPRKWSVKVVFWHFWKVWRLYAVATLIGVLCGFFQLSTFSTAQIIGAQSVLHANWGSQSGDKNNTPKSQWNIISFILHNVMFLSSYPGIFKLMCYFYLVSSQSRESRVVSDTLVGGRALVQEKY